MDVRDKFMMEYTHVETILSPAQAIAEIAIN
jgi:hypothetical protein